MAIEGTSTWLTVAEAARLLNLTTCRIHQFIREGRLSSKRLGDRFLVVPMEDLERFRQIPRHTGGKGHQKNQR